MEREKMIEEMAMLLCKDICFRKICAVANHCKIKNCKMREKATLLYYFIVKKYNDFIPEGSVVLTKEELAKHDEKVCKETAGEILKLIKPKCKICDVNMHKGCMCMQEQAEEAIKKAYSIVDEVKEEIEDEDLPQLALFPNPSTKEKRAFETIIFQNRDNGYISDAYRNDIDVVCNGLNILHALQNKLENNTLYRVFPFETAKAIENYLKNDEDIKEWLE